MKTKIMEYIRNRTARIGIRLLLWGGGWKLETLPHGMRWKKGNFVGNWQYAIYMCTTTEFWDEKRDDKKKESKL